MKQLKCEFIQSVRLIMEDGQSKLKMNNFFLDSVRTMSVLYCSNNQSIKCNYKPLECTV